MKKYKFIKLLCLGGLVIAWDWIFTYISTYIHCKYGSVQMDTGQASMIYKLFVEHSQLCNEIVLFILFGLFLIFLIDILRSINNED